MLAVSGRTSAMMLRRGAATIKASTRNMVKTRWESRCLKQNRTSIISGFQQMRVFSSNISEESTHKELSAHGLEELSKLVESGKVHEALVMIEQVDKQALDQIETTDALEDLRISLLNKWIVHQQMLFDKFMALKQSETSSADMNREHVIRICEAAGTAHRLLEEHEPFYSGTRVPQLDTPASLVESDDALPEERGVQPLRNRRDLTESCNSVLAAWALASRAAYEARNDSHGIITTIRAAQGIPQRAQFLLERMEALTEAGHDSTRKNSIACPSTCSYNHVMEAWAYSKEHLRGVMAERVFQKLSQGSFTPDVDSFRHIIWAWAMSTDTRAAFTATGHLMKMLRILDKGDTEMMPTLDDFKVVFRAWTRAEDKMSPGKALSVLRLMDYYCRKGFRTLQPDRECFRCILQTAAKRPLLTDLGPTVDDLLERMNGALIPPDSDCFSAAIRTWKNAAFHPDLLTYRESSVRRTIELLEAMETTHYQTTAVKINIHRSTVHDVLECLAISHSAKKLQDAEDLLKKVEDVASERATANCMWPTPDAETYRLVLDVLSSTKIKSNEEKITKAKVIVERSEANDKKTHSDPTTRVYNAFIRVCASCHRRGTEGMDGIELLGEAINVMEKMRKERIAATSETYVDLLDAAHKLLEDGKEKRQLVSYIFRFCCEDGMVNDAVLNRLQEVASDDQYTSLVVVHGEDMEGTKVVPEVWTRNALSGKVISFDGRKTKPLTIDGNLKVTVAMQEFKMRRLRDKRNRILLRGGRLH